MKKVQIIIIMFLTVFFIGCASNSGHKDFYEIYYSAASSMNDEFTEIQEKGFISTEEEDTTYFSIDANTASYSTIRNYINNNIQINKDMVNIEGMLNYFNYDLKASDDVITISAEGAVCPWNANNYLFGIGLKAKDVEVTKQHNNIVFLLDVSGSMYADNKLGLLKNSLKLFLENINDDDTVSIVVYAGEDKVLLKGAKGFERKKIGAILEDLEASGSTAGSRGIQTAYQIAKENFIEGGNNRVILGTDGDFNVGISDTNELKNFISEKRDEGIYLTALGFGMGNFKADKLEVLATAGNGNFAYIDSINEAKKALVEEIGGTMITVAADVKASVTFNKDIVKSYRLLGYENKGLTEEQYNDENTDAGEVGSGHELYVMFEVELNEAYTDACIMQTEITYKDPKTKETHSITSPFTKENIKTAPSEDFIFAGCVVEAALVMRESNYKADASYSQVIKRLNTLQSVKSDAYRAEFLQLISKLNK